MAEIVETFFSRHVRLGNSPGTTLEFVIFGAGEENNAETELFAYLTRENLATYKGLSPQTLDLQPGGWRHDGKWFRATVEFGLGTGLGSTGEGAPKPRFRVRFGGENVRILQGLADANSFVKDGTPKIDFGRAINVTPDGVEGVEIRKPVFSFSLDFSIPTTMFTTAYQAQIARLAFTTNDRPWRDFAKEEVLFEGLEGSGELGTRTELSLAFSVVPHATGLKVGEIENIEKPGHQYLWVFYEQVVDATGKVLKKWPRQVDVIPVFLTSDFRQLGVGD